MSSSTKALTKASQKADARIPAKAQRLACQSRLPRAAMACELIKHYPITRFRHKLIAGYWPMAEEADTRPLLKALSEIRVELALPVTPPLGEALQFRRFQWGDQLASGRYGTQEPLATQEEVSPSVVLVPLLAFTAEGHRLGYGGGYYDRSLAKLRQGNEIFACGIAYSGQEVAHLPIGRYDAPLDGILTETYFRIF